MTEDYYKPFLVWEIIGDTLFAVEQLLLGQGRIVMGKDQSGRFDDEWMYATLADAVIEFQKWDKVKDDEPEGWTRHKPSMRRRPDGNKSLEEVRE